MEIQSLSVCQVGPDSMALLYLLMEIRNEYGIVLKAAHLNHGFRKEAADEAKFVRKTAASLGLPVVISSINVPAIKETDGISAQEAARKARYAFLQRQPKRPVHRWLHLPIPQMTRQRRC